MNEVKKINLAEGSFIANGKKYIISNSISVERYKEYEKLEPKLTYGVGFEELFRNVKKAYEAVNQQKFADIQLAYMAKYSLLKSLLFALF